MIRIFKLDVNLYLYYIFYIFFIFFFFFQAEDGIRDGTVTGVQTCALPIYAGVEITGRSRAGGETLTVTRDSSSEGITLRSLEDARAQLSNLYGVLVLAEIGRASCRERVYISVVAVSLIKRDVMNERSSVEE